MKANWNCEQVEQELPSYVDGLLPATELAALEAHVQACARCEESLASWQRALGSLRAGGPRRATQAEVAGVMAALDDLQAPAVVPSPVQHVVQQAAQQAVPGLAQERRDYRRALHAAGWAHGPSRRRRVLAGFGFAVLGAAAALWLMMLLGEQRRGESAGPVAEMVLAEQAVSQPQGPAEAQAGGREDSMRDVEPLGPQLVLDLQPITDLATSLWGGLRELSSEGLEQWAQAQRSTEQQKLRREQEARWAQEQWVAVLRDRHQLHEDGLARELAADDQRPVKPTQGVLAGGGEGTKLAAAHELAAGGSSLSLESPESTGFLSLLGPPHPVRPRLRAGVAELDRSGTQVTLHMAGDLRQAVPTLLGLLTHEDQQLVAVAVARLEVLRLQVDAVPGLEQAVEAAMAAASSASAEPQAPERGWWSSLFGPERSVDDLPAIGSEAEEWDLWWTVAEPLLPADHMQGAA